MKMMKMGKILLQDAFLAALCQERIPVSIFLLNGTKVQGMISAFDQFTVLLKTAENRLIYKNLIASVVPLQRVRHWKPEEASTAIMPLEESISAASSE